MPDARGREGKPIMSAPIRERIRAARGLFGQWGPAWRTDGRVRALAEALRDAIRASRQAMETAGVFDLCRQCEEEEGGSCCGAGIEDRYDPVLLAVNLLLGAALPEEPAVPGGCLFLGERGCRLAARHVLCVNYLCLKIQERLPLRDVIRVQEVAGREMEALFLLEEELKRGLRRGQGGKPDGP